MNVRRSFSLASKINTLPPEIGQLQEATLAFGKEHILPFANEWDRNGYLPQMEVYQKSQELGHQFAAIYTSAENGGSELGLFAASAILEALAYCCTSTARNIQAHNMNCKILENHGTDEQKKEWLKEMCKFNILSSFCFNEAGHDPSYLKMKSRSEGDDFVLDGSKVYIGAAKSSQILMVFAKSTSKEVSLIGVPTDAKGISFPNDEKEVGWNQMVQFDEVRVPRRNMIGQMGQGHEIGKESLIPGRVLVSSNSLGGVWYALELAREFMMSQTKGGKPLTKQDSLSFEYADHIANLISNRTLVRTAAIYYDEDDIEMRNMSAIAKLKTMGHSRNTVNQCIHLIGQHDPKRTREMERIHRDIRSFEISESENVMRMLISREQFN